MNKKLVLFACALIAGNANFGMEEVPQPTQPTPAAPTAEMLVAGSQHNDDATPSGATTSQSVTEEPAPISKPVLRNRKSATSKLTELLAAGYAKAPKQVQMMCDKVAEHPKVAGSAAFVAGECCMMNCCPEVFKLVNYFALGWGAHAAYATSTKIKKN